MQVVQIYMHNSLRNFNYIIYSEKSKDAIFVDPFDLSITLPVAHKLGLRPKYLINTHKHYDHIQDNEKFLDLPETTFVELKNGQRLELSQDEYIQAIDTPGHVMDHQCFIVIDKEEAIGLICGDALFNAGVGNCKNGGNVHIHFHSIYKVIRELPARIKIYPSHDYLLNNLLFAQSIEKNNSDISQMIKKRKTQDLECEFIITDLATEMKINPFFRLNEKEIVNHFPQAKTEEERFIAMRKLRDNW